MVRKYFKGAEKDNNTRINQSRDTGLAIVLIVLLFTYFTHNLRLLPVAIVLLFICMVWPKIFKPMASVFENMAEDQQQRVNNIWHSPYAKT